MIRRLLALAALLGPALLVGISVVPAHAAAWQVYHNARYGYTFSYPPNWERASAGFATSLGADFVVNTTDQDTTFFAITPTTVEAAIKNHQRDYVYYELVNLGVPRGDSIHFSTRSVHGTTYTQGVAQITEPHERGTVTVLLTVKSKLVYIFASTRLTDRNGKPRRNAAAQGQALDKIVATITLN